MTPLIQALAAHPFLAGLADRHIAELAGCARIVALPGGHRIFAEDAPADRFWLLVDGRVALTVHVPGRGEVQVETVGPGRLLGWSWLSPPRRWLFSAHAVLPTEAIELFGPGVLDRCEADPTLGYALTRRFVATVVDQLQSTRLRMLDLYAVRPGAVS